jgi:hypothetical protein
MRKLVLLLAALVVTGGVASAVNKIGTNGTDLLVGPTGTTTSWAGAATISSRASKASTI